MPVLHPVESGHDLIEIGRGFIASAADNFITRHNHSPVFLYLNLSGTKERKDHMRMSCHAVHTIDTNAPVFHIQEIKQMEEHNAD